jgi:hypothetical protein
MLLGQTHSPALALAGPSQVQAMKISLLPLTTLPR